MSPAARLFALLILPVLAACSSLPPEAQCFADATIEYRAAWRGVQQIDADLARGYGLRRQEIRIAQTFACGAGRCLMQGREELAFPTPIDAGALRARRQVLIARLDALRPAAKAAALRCGYPPPGGAGTRPP
ncbi:hypothetical protein [Sinisalibacter aestuarii]|uniref:Lipoprotein n=1 Tax=Sinisalibacter aestuarii TaxID=2949426 RepID=A0ABQ5LVD0_9RHOB|nr:hypothetical protein [Sinisalibacter aestuarii]GKY88296.1 hypothetical protein STA1M1_21650 [Sinisalibacter aestuarii]